MRTRSCFSYDNSLEQLLRHLHPDLKRSIRQALDDLASHPVNRQTARIEELAGLWSLRVSHYRVIYQMDAGKHHCHLSGVTGVTVYERMREVLLQIVARRSVFSTNFAHSDTRSSALIYHSSLFIQHSSLFTFYSSFFIHLSPALRNAAICRSNTAGSLIGIRCLCTSSENLGLSRRTSATSARASAAWPNSL